MHPPLAANQYQDLFPVPPERRNWDYKTYTFLYFGWSMDNWTLGSTMIGISLNWWQSILVIFTGQMINSIFQAINSRCGAVYHISFPVVSRSIFGMVGSYFAVITRSILSIIYYALKLYIGSNFMGNMLRAIFGSAFTDLPNHIPKSMGITTSGLVAFTLYWLIFVPIMFLRPNQMRWIFTMKMISIVPAYIGLFVFCMINTKGQFGDGLPTAAKTSPTKLSWFIMSAINAAMGNSSLTTTNQPDFSRWSRTRWAPIIPQMICNPISITIASTFGILATTAVNKAWNLELWNPWDLLDEIMTRYWRPGARFAVFVCALGHGALVLGTNVAGNIIPLGSDCSMLFPRYINIVRGQFLGLFLSWCVMPWKILASAEVFTTFLSGYAIFMASIVGPTVVDYYYFTKGNLFLAELYNGSKHNPYYWYWKGWNIQALVAYLIGMILPFPGFIGTLGVQVPLWAIHMCYVGWLLSFFVSALAYYVICIFWPTAVHRAIKQQDMKWEALAAETETIIDGLFHASRSVGVADDEKAPGMCSSSHMEFHTPVAAGSSESLAQPV